MMNKKTVRIEILEHRAIRSRPPMNSSVKGEEKNRMKKVSCLRKRHGAFSFHLTIESQGGCAVEIVCTGPQYW
jgi:hypothetical protein